MSIGVVSEQRLFVHERDGYRCRYCGIAVEIDGPLERMATIDHIVARHKFLIRHTGEKVDRLGTEPGHANHEDNLVTACHPCNNRKGRWSLEEVGMTVIPLPVVSAP